MFGIVFSRNIFVVVVVVELSVVPYFFGKYFHQKACIDPGIILYVVDTKIEHVIDQHLFFTGLSYQCSLYDL